MRRNIESLMSKIGGPRDGKPDRFAGFKIALGLLALANVAVYFVLVNPPGGSAAGLEAQLDGLRKQTAREQSALVRLRGIAQKVRKARAEQEGFMKEHFMDRRSASSAILAEIEGSARKTGLKLREHAFGIEPVEGADNISMMTITANYEGNYGDLVEFVNLVDRSDRFLIIDNIQAAPLQQTGLLSMRFKLNTFVRENAAAPAMPRKPEATPPRGERPAVAARVAP